MPHPWRCSKAGCVEPLAAWPARGQPAHGRGWELDGLSVSSQRNNLTQPKLLYGFTYKGAQQGSAQDPAVSTKGVAAGTAGTAIHPQQMARPVQGIQPFTAGLPRSIQAYPVTLEAYDCCGTHRKAPHYFWFSFGTHHDNDH